MLKFKAELSDRLLLRFNESEVDSVLKYVEQLITTKYCLQDNSKSITKYSDNNQICSMYLMAKGLEGCNANTLRSIKGTLNTFFRIVNKDIKDIVSNDVRYYLAQFKGTVSDASLDQSRKMVFSFFNWCINEGYVNRNPVCNIHKIKADPSIPREPLNLMEVELMRKACITLREKAIFETLYSTGCRVSELCGLNKLDLDIDNGTVHLFGKGKKHRTSFLNAKSKIAIKDYLDSRDDSNDAVFVSDRSPHKRLTSRAVEGIIGEIVRRTPITKKVTPHIMRHTMATIALSNGMKIEEISRILGHASVETTMIYTKISIDDIKIKHSKCIV